MHARFSLTLLAAALLVTACGQKGPLFLPGDVSGGTLGTPVDSSTSAGNEGAAGDEPAEESAGTPP